VQDREATQVRRVFRASRVSAATLVRKGIQAVKARKEMWGPRVRQALREMWDRQVPREISVRRGREGFPVLQVPAALQALWARRV